MISGAARTPARCGGCQTPYGNRSGCSSAPSGALIWLSGLLYAGSGGGVFLVMAAVGGSALLLAPALARAMAVHANAPGP